jgi:hypothetical protein
MSDMPLGLYDSLPPRGVAPLPIFSQTSPSLNNFIADQNFGSSPCAGWDRWGEASARTQPANRILVADASPLHAVVVMARFVLSFVGF